LTSMARGSLRRKLDSSKRRGCYSKAAAWPWRDVV